MHRQPTPGSIASAEQQAGDLSSADFEAITEAMDAARRADDQDDRAGCEKALSEVDRVLDRSRSPQVFSNDPDPLIDTALRGGS